MRVAVVGSGVSGLAATWLLNEYSKHEVHLYEADSRPGGHANTVAFKPPGRDGEGAVDVDSGFIVFNLATYPNFSRFLSLCKIPWNHTEMTFSLSRSNGAFEWAGKSPLTMFCQLSNLLDSGMWRMIWDVLRFNANAGNIISQIDAGDVSTDVSLGEYLRREQYSDAFLHNYILPITASLWCTPPDVCALEFPIASHVRFMYNHHLLQIVQKPPWLTVTGGSKRYVQRVLSKLPPKRLHLSTGIVSVTTRPTGNPETPFSVKLVTTDGQTLEYDYVILATHADTTLNMLKNGENQMTEMEEKVLQGVSWTQNRLVVHSDSAFMPVRKSAWSCWNFLSSPQAPRNKRDRADVDKITLTYNMNQLQDISKKKYGDVLCTLNPPFEPRSNTIAHQFQYSHPVYNKESTWSRRHLHEIQNTRGLTYAGAWTRNGFHEDGFTSGIVVAVQYLGAECPFSIHDTDRKVGPQDSIYAGVFEYLEVWRRILSFWLYTWLAMFGVIGGEKR